MYYTVRHQLHESRQVGSSEHDMRCRRVQRGLFCSNGSVEEFDGGVVS